MAKDRETPTDSSAYTPDFELPRYDAIHEDNWPEYEARGFRPVGNVREDDLGHIKYFQGVFGVEHVYTGDAYSYVADRPLRHKPGKSIYVTPEGMEWAAEKARRTRQWRDEREMQERQGSSDQPPNTNP